MFSNDVVKKHLLTSATIRSNAKLIAEWNINSLENIKYVGNYRFRPLEGVSGKYGFLPSFFDELDEGNFYTGATDSDIVLDGGVSDEDVPMLLAQSKEKEKLLFSLEDCFGRFRPRSGINKVRYGITKYIHHSNPDMAQRPRYYMASREDKFKYWSSYRLEGGTEYGVANASPFGTNHINDAAPFVVYKEQIATNKIVIKMQTNVGDVDLSPMYNLNGVTADPLYGVENQTTPSKWQVDVLINNKWEKIISFNPQDLREDGTPIIGADGYVEISYGVIVPREYSKIFFHSGTVSSVLALPKTASYGESFLVKTESNDLGLYYIWLDGGYEAFIPSYGWKLSEQDVTQSSDMITNLGDPDYYFEPNNKNLKYREAVYIQGIRVGVERMNKFGSTFDLIEMSPRLVADITDMTSEYSLSKIASDLGSAGMPVGQLLASNGSITMFDVDQAFNNQNALSLINFSSLKNMQLKIYEQIDIDGALYYVPIKTLYADAFPQTNSKSMSVSIELRDLYFYLESMQAPELFLTNVSLSYAVSTLLDYIGFSNYTFKRVDGEIEDIIPFFYTNPDNTVAEVLQDLATSTQSSMFFDEYNNFVVMSRNYMMASSTQRSTDMMLIGTRDFDRNGVYQNENLESELANIIEIASQTDEIYNDGNVDYAVRYIQKSQANTAQTYQLDSEKTWLYKPVLLWQSAGEENIKAQNEQTSTQNAYSLTAIPLKSDLSDVVPYVSGGQVVSNIIDLGEAVYWLGRYNGYFYANGEVIRFDAIEYSIPGIVSTVWITSTDEYQNYFSKIPFRGKMYPTGRVRIYSEPNYIDINGQTVLQDGAVIKHGRGQFGTQVTYHTAGLNQKWTDGSRVKGVSMNSKFLFGIGDMTDDLTISTALELSEEQVTLRNTILLNKATIKNYNDRLVWLKASLLKTPGDVWTIQQITDLNNEIVTLQATTSTQIKQFADSISASNKVLDNASSTSQAKRSDVAGKIMNFLSYSYGTEDPEKRKLSTDSEMVQASALVVSGTGMQDSSYSALNHITYVHTEQPVNSGDVETTNVAHTHFGTRMRIIGKILSSEDTPQEATGAMPYVTVETDTPEDKPNITGGSGGISGLLNAATGEGYYYEIVALDSDNTEKYGFGNVYFYKLVSGGASSTGYTVPELLWRGIANITVDSGNFVGQSRIFAQENQTVYDLAFEYVDNVDKTRTFYLYFNGTQIATVVDTSPITAGHNSALFVRGTSKCMFENIYSMSNNYADSPATKLDPVINSAFGTDAISINDSFSKYSISGLVQSSYLSSISPSGTPAYNIYYDEFGTIMREAAYMNVKYDKAYPALYSRILPNFNTLKTYAISSFFGGAYSAEFLIFNTTDTAIALDSNTNSGLAIQGITLTQSSDNKLTVDEFFTKKSDFSNPVVENGTVVSSTVYSKQQYQDIKNSRSTYGRKEFSLSAPYIQSRDSANSLMSWLSSKIMKPRKSIGVSIFPMPILQLGDIVQIDYQANNVFQVSPESRFVVYQIDYSRGSDGPNMTVYLSEVES